MIDYLVHSSITNLKNPSKVVDIKVAGSGFKILLTPLIDDVLQGAGEGYTLVTLLQQPWYSYPFMLPLKDYVDPRYILEKLFRDDKTKIEEAEKLCYVLKKIKL